MTLAPYLAMFRKPSRSTMLAEVSTKIAVMLRELLDGLTQNTFSYT